MSIASIASVSASIFPSPAAAAESGFDDPIFAAIERHRTAEAAYVAACEASFDKNTCAAASELGDQADYALAALVAGQPTTLAGCAAALRYVDGFTKKSNQGQIFEGFTLVERPAVRFLSRVAATISQAGDGSAKIGLSKSDSSEPDSIFAAIDRHREAWREMDALLDEQGRIESANKQAGRHVATGLEAIEASVDTAGNKERDAAWDLVTTEPDTLKGIAAMLSYLREVRDRRDIGFTEDDFVAALNSSIEAAICRIADLPEPDMPKMLEALSAD